MMVTSLGCGEVYIDLRGGPYFIDLSDLSVYTVQEMSPSYNILYIVC